LYKAYETEPHIRHQITLAALLPNFLRNDTAFLQVLKTAEIKFFGYSCFDASTEYIQDLNSLILYKKVLF